MIREISLANKNPDKIFPTVPQVNRHGRIIDETTLQIDTDFLESLNSYIPSLHVKAHRIWVVGQFELGEFFERKQKKIRHYNY